MPENEIIRKTARSFLSSEDPNGGPILVIDFTPVPEPAPLTVLGLSLLAFGWLRRRRK
jgi:MYXO-CTERM domain-containing protein